MKNLLSLTKIGNIKMGRVVEGNPLALEKMIVTRATKENEENFIPYPGFDSKGLEQLEITLPFNDIDLNFEVNYISFLEIDSIEYIAKAKDIGEEIILYPLNPEDFDLEPLSLLKLTEEKVKSFEFTYTGFLKVMIPKVSSYGEVFYFKTSSINTIRAIKDQLLLTKTLLDGNLAHVPLILKPIKKDTKEGNQVIFLSIGINDETIKEYFSETIHTDSKLNFKKLDSLYLESRNETEFKSVDKDVKIKVLSKNYKEVVTLDNQEEKENKIFKENNITEEEISLINNYTNYPLMVVIKYIKYLKANNENYLEIFKEKLDSEIQTFEMLKEIE